jgi:hypothetical protein
LGLRDAKSACRCPRCQRFVRLARTVRRRAAPPCGKCLSFPGAPSVSAQKCDGRHRLVRESAGWWVVGTFDKGGSHDKADRVHSPPHRYQPWCRCGRRREDYWQRLTSALMVLTPRSRPEGSFQHLIDLRHPTGVSRSPAVCRLSGPDEAKKTGVVTRRLKVGAKGAMR